MNEAGVSFQGLSDDEVTARLRSLLGSGARLEARIVAHLAEVEARRIHLLARRSSMFEYCQKDLGLSDYEAFCRIAAARLAAKYPVIFGMLERRELHLTALVEVRAFLTEDNHRELLQAITGKTKREIREILAHRFPEADVAERIRKLAAENRAGTALTALSPDRYQLQLTIRGDLKRQLELALDLLSHANPDRDLAVVLERALPLLVGQLRSRRFGMCVRAARTKKRDGRLDDAGDGSVPAAKDATASSPRTSESPTSESPTSESPTSESPTSESPTSELRPNGSRRAIPANVHRQVARRDGEQCSFVDEQGRRCECRAFLQLHHRQPWARGGADAAENLQLLCRQHNVLGRTGLWRGSGRRRHSEAASRVGVAPVHWLAHVALCEDALCEDALCGDALCAPAAEPGASL